MSARHHTRRRAFALGTVLLLTLAPHLGAVLCTIDEVPAATLLFPYVFVDLDTCADPERAESILSITNTDSEAHIVHITLWTDWAVATLDFDVYLTGYDVQTIRLGDIFCDGNLPSTGSAVANHGALSGAPVPFGDCNNSTVPGDGPLYQQPFSALLIQQIQDWFTGQEGIGTPGQCASSDYGDNVARGFVTVDVARECSLFFPSSPGYFESIAGFDNVLLGDVQEVEPATGRAVSLPAVHLEAAPVGFFGAGDHTFYGRFTGADGSDRREPLPTGLAARFDPIVGSTGTAETGLRVWREVPITNSVACGSVPAWAPLTGADTVIFDQEENPVFPSLALANATNDYDLSGDPLNPYTAGWAMLNLQHGAISAYNDDFAQGWVTVIDGARDAQGMLGYAGGRHAQALDSTCATKPISVPIVPPAVVPALPIFADGFESGDVSLWAFSVP